jgi:hypothetical protein
VQLSIYLSWTRRDHFGKALRQTHDRGQDRPSDEGLFTTKEIYFLSSQEGLVTRLVLYMAVHPFRNGSVVIIYVLPVSQSNGRRQRRWLSIRKYIALSKYGNMSSYYSRRLDQASLSLTRSHCSSTTSSNLEFENDRLVGFLVALAQF